MIKVRNLVKKFGDFVAVNERPVPCDVKPRESEYFARSSLSLSGKGVEPGKIYHFRFFEAQIPDSSNLFVHL